MVQLPPLAVVSCKETRGADAKVEFGGARFAHPTLAPDEEMEILSALTAEIIELDGDAGRAQEQTLISTADRRPPPSDPADGVVHAGLVALRPVARQGIKVTRIESMVEFNQGVDGLTIATCRFSPCYDAEKIAHVSFLGLH